MRPLSIKNTAAAITTSVLSAQSPSLITHQQRSPWNSPVPYLFGGLAAMMSLIAFALLILACSYWRHSIRSAENGGVEGVGEDEKQSGSEEKATNKACEEKVLVIMAGEDRPTFLATPVMTTTMTKGLRSEDKTGNLEEDSGREKTVNGEKVKENGEESERSEET